MAVWRSYCAFDSPTAFIKFYLVIKNKHNDGYTVHVVLRWLCLGSGWVQERNGGTCSTNIVPVHGVLQVRIMHGVRTLQLHERMRWSNNTHVLWGFSPTQQLFDEGSEHVGGCDLPASITCQIWIHDLLINQIRKGSRQNAKLLRQWNNRTKELPIQQSLCCLQWWPIRFPSQSAWKLVHRLQPHTEALVRGCNNCD